jgi:hypothetical protein
MEGEKEVTVVRVKGRLQLRYEGKKCDDANQAYEVLDRLLDVWGEVLAYRANGGDGYPLMRTDSIMEGCTPGRWPDVAAHFVEVERLFEKRGRPVVHRVLAYICSRKAMDVNVEIQSAVDWMWEGLLSALELEALTGVTTRYVKEWRRWAVIELGLWEPARHFTGNYIKEEEKV